jgi:hypothetical protein
MSCCACGPLFVGDVAEGCNIKCKRAYIGDNNCNTEYYNPACGWDGGDCDDQCECRGLPRGEAQNANHMISTLIICVLMMLFRGEAGAPFARFAYGTWFASDKVFNLVEIVHHASLQCVNKKTSLMSHKSLVRLLYGNPILALDSLNEKSL